MIRTILVPVATLLLALQCASAATEEVLIKTRDGANISAIVTLPDSRGTEKLPTVLQFSIYAEVDKHKAELEGIAARGYAAVYAYTRGKYQSPDAIVPYEHDGADATAVIDWISKQPWSNGKVGMIGSSYSGFAAWAAAKHRHPALKVIATSAAAIPGQGWPMYNNVFLGVNYVWTFYTTHNKTVDDAVGGDAQRWRKLLFDWFESGRPFRELDKVEGTPNPWFQRWLGHPAFDSYWQDMVPWQRDFARIEIPALSITGFYDDAQISAIKYFTEHVQWRRQAEHYLVVGPYDHFGSHASEKPADLRGYAIDTVAQMNSPELKLGFMDYVLKEQPKPKLLENRVNLQVMGANAWRSGLTLDGMHGIPMRLYFSSQKEEGLYTLPYRQPPSDSRVVHEVDMANRRLLHGFHSYPGEIIQGPLQYVTESVFSTQPFGSSTTLLGSFSGELQFVTNKKDFDLSVVVYEAMPDGKLFFLAHALHRASYAEDPQKRRLLSPGKPQRLRFETTVTARKMKAGSRLLVLVDVNKHPMAQVNYGTGKDVSDESVQDAGEPLKLEILGGSYFEVPIDNAIQKPN